jgi:potassium/hydrogen antiporter
MTLTQLYFALLAGGLVLIVSIAAARLAARVGLPSLLLFLALGVTLGEDGLGLAFDDAQLAQNLDIAALGVILVEGGLTTRWADVRPMLAPATALAVVGVGTSVVLTAAGAHLLLGLDWQLALLLGAIVSSTDAAAVFAVLRDLPISRRLAGMLEAESGFNDAPTVILVALFATAPAGAGLGGVLVNLVYQLAAGTLIGLVIGRLGVTGLRRVALPATGLYPVTAFGLGMVAFAAAGAAQASGFIAAYLAALVMGNSGLPHRTATGSFAEGLGWIAQIGLFVLLGLLITPRELPGQLLPALVVGTVLVLVARPVSVVVSLAPFGIPWRQQAFASWAGLRGAVPIVLATMPVVTGVPGSDQLLDIVFAAVVLFTLVQGPSLPVLARLLGLSSPNLARELTVEAAPLDTLDAELLTLTVPPDSRLRGVALHELRLPHLAVSHSSSGVARLRAAPRSPARGRRSAAHRVHHGQPRGRRTQAPRRQPSRPPRAMVRGARRSRTDLSFY